MRKHEKSFTKIVWNYYRSHGRHALPWRKAITPYAVLISEVMLQQTQVERVIPKFNRWMDAFPTIRILAQAPLKKIMKYWQGLGYNNRALRLKMLVEVVVGEYGGKIPKARESLIKLPGVGAYTAGAICAFAWNIPEVFIETNIRRVFLHHFFPKRTMVPDNELLPLIEKTMDEKNIREWYWALMDYGASLRNEVSNPNKRSAHYTKQKPFKGSNRELRGILVRALLEKKQTIASLQREMKSDPDRIKEILLQLCKESIVTKRGNYFFIQ